MDRFAMEMLRSGQSCSRNISFVIEN